MIKLTLIAFLVLILGSIGFFNSSVFGGGSPTDEFVGTLTSAIQNTYSYVYRVSLDNGLSWNYVDLDGTGNGFDTAQLGSMVVGPGPDPDPDLDLDGFTASVDCDDGDPLVFPGAAEFRDGKNNDCDLDGKADEGLIQLGDIIITEILYDSSQIPDVDGEWFEVFNPTDRSINLRTWEIRDGVEIATILTDVIVPPRDFAVLCSNSDFATNGGVNCDYQYSSFTLLNTADTVILEFDGLTVDSVAYDEGAGWAAASSGSLNLDPDAFLLDNNNAINWCNSPVGVSIANGDEATPGVSNVSCSNPVSDPEVTAVHPDNGIDAGGTSVRIVGSGFVGTSDVQINGVSCSSFVTNSDNQITCDIPAGTAGTADITVIEGVVSDTLSGQFSFTSAATAGGLVDSAITDRPSSTTFTANTISEIIFGQIQESGITGSVCPASGEYAGLIAEVGFGNLATNPTSDGSWVWFPAFCDSQTSIGGGGSPVGSISIPIESTSLILADAQSFSWMIPVILSVLGIGLVLVRRK